MGPLLKVENISKYFSGLCVLNNISIDFYSGKAHVLLGENGAGKSTLIKIISGIYHKDAGEIILDGNNIEPKSPREGIDYGISVIHQELSVISGLNVAENIFLDNLPRRARLVNYKKLYADTRQLMKRLKVTNISPKTKVRDLSVADRQMVEIMRAVSRDSKIVIMDEPTSSLSDREINSLFSVVENLKKENVVIIYITHKLKEIAIVGDDISILRDGELICTKEVKDLTEKEMVRLMVGRDIGDYYIRAPYHGKTEAVLAVKNLSGKGFSDISFELKRGEVLGFAGLIGAGRTELMRAIFGADQYQKGEVVVYGEKQMFRHPKSAISVGIGLVPEDRREQGVILDSSIANNISIVSINDEARNGFINFGWERKTAKSFIDKLRIKSPNEKTTVRNLSGGNQQKVVLAKWLAAKSRILILDEPTRGIDVNAKSEIYNLISDYVKEGGSVILVSSELPEIIGISHRIAVMRNGVLTGMVDQNEMTEEIIMGYATAENMEQ